MNEKLMRRVGYIVIGSFAVFNVFTLLTFDMSLVGTGEFGPYSIFASKEIFYAFHIWGIIVPIVTIYAMVKQSRMLFSIGLLLLMLLMFYPIFTAEQPNPVPAKKSPPADSSAVSTPGPEPAPDTTAQLPDATS